MTAVSAGEGGDPRRAGAGLPASGAALTPPYAPLAVAAAAADPTDGWTQTSFSYSWQKPWNLDLSARHSYSGGVHRMWDADVYLPSGTDGASFVQILRGVHPSGTPATDIMLNVYDTGGGPVLRTGAYDTWFNVKIAHQASSGTGTVRVYLDDSLVLTVADRGPATRYFKNGVYNHGPARAFCSPVVRCAQCRVPHPGVPQGTRQLQLLGDGRALGIVEEARYGDIEELGERFEVALGRVPGTADTAVDPHEPSTRQEVLRDHVTRALRRLEGISRSRHP